MQSLSIFGGRKDQVLYFTNLSKFGLIENCWFKWIGPGPRATMARVGLNRLRPHLSAAPGYWTCAPDRSPLLPPDHLDVGRRRRRVGLLPTPSLSSGYKTPGGRSFFPQPPLLFVTLSPHQGEPPRPLATG
jgi:hypothetical protein